MKNCLLLALMATLALLLGCQACSEPTRLDGAGEIDVHDVATAMDTTSVFDIEQPEVSLADPATAADLVDDAADGFPNPGDATSTLSPWCEKDLPMPGEPCSKLGEVRCTNVGAKGQFTTISRCIRPNTVRCQTSVSGGEATWVLEPCPSPGKVCQEYWGFTCASGKSGDKCVVQALLLKSPSAPPPSPFDQQVETCEGHEGAERCYGDRTPNRCTTFDQLPGDVANEIKRVMGPCASYLSDVPYFYPSELCSLDYIYCKTIPPSGGKPPKSVPTSLNKCYIDAKTGQPHCAKTCAEAGAIEVW